MAAWLFERAGYLPTMVLFLGVILKVLAKRAWGITVLLALVGSIAAYVLFGRVLMIGLPSGILPFSVRRTALTCPWHRLAAGQSACGRMDTCFCGAVRSTEYGTYVSIAQACRWQVRVAGDWTLSLVALHEGRHAGGHRAESIIRLLGYSHANQPFILCTGCPARDAGRCPAGDWSPGGYYAVAAHNVRYGTDFGHYYARRDLLRGHVWRLDHLDPGQYPGGGGLRGDLFRRLPDGTPGACRSRRCQWRPSARTLPGASVWWG